MFCLEHPENHNYPTALKSVLYKIRWRKKVTFKDVQKIFENISICFIMAYTAQLLKNKQVSYSAFMTPVLHESRVFYKDFLYRNVMRINPKEPVLVNEPKQSDLIFEIRLLDANGIPIPQHQGVKSSIVNRAVNVTFYDTSTESGKDCICSLQVDFDPDVEDQWLFNKNNRSLFVKVGNYDLRKY